LSAKNTKNGRIGSCHFWYFSLTGLQNYWINSQLRTGCKKLVSRAYSFAPFPPKSRACVQYQYLNRSMRHVGNVCAPDFVAIQTQPGGLGWASLSRSLNRHRWGRGCCIQRLKLNEFTKTKRWRNCKNGLTKVKIIVNWSVRKRKTFENNYSQVANGNATTVHNEFKITKKTNLGHQI